MKKTVSLLFGVFIYGAILSVLVHQTHGTDTTETVQENVMGAKEGSKTDTETVAREEEAILLDGVNVSDMKKLRESAEKHAFQAEVDRMMKLIINSLYKNKEIFLRELISNASDALDKIRFLALTSPDAMKETDDTKIWIKADKDTKTIRIRDTGIGMTKEELIKNLGTIARSGTAEFVKNIEKNQSGGKGEGEKTSGAISLQDQIGQFGVGFYSSYLVADRVTVISKNNRDKQYIWESDASSFSIMEDPRGNTLKRGTEIILHLKEGVFDFLEQSTLKTLVGKYSQFINFPIYLWASRTEMVEETKPAEDKPADEKKEPEAEKKEDDATVEEEKEKEKKDEPKKVEKTIWDWELVNKNKPIWMRKSSEVSDDEYNEFFKTFSKSSESPLGKTHFGAEGEVTFKSILFIPRTAPSDLYNSADKKTDNIKMYVRRVFITDDFSDMMPKYLNFIVGIVDSDDLPLNVSRETLQQNKLLKVIKKKLVRKALDMMAKLSKDDFLAFYKQYSTSLKLGIMEDHTNRSRLAKLLRFHSSNSAEEKTSLADYVGRMKDGQEAIFYMAGSSLDQVRKSPFVERLLKLGYEVLYLVEAVDEYVMSHLHEFEGKKFQDVAKEGLKMPASERAKQRKEALAKEYQPLLTWLKDEGLKDRIEKAELSDRLDQSPAALVATSYSWSGNYERVMTAQAYQRAEDPNQSYQVGKNQIMELNPRHPVVRELKGLLGRGDKEQATDLALVLFDTAKLRSGFILRETVPFAERIDKMLRRSLNIPVDEKVEVDEEDEEIAASKAAAEKEGAGGKTEEAGGPAESTTTDESPKEEL